jgi:hypothetical protein
MGSREKEISLTLAARSGVFIDGFSFSGLIFLASVTTRLAEIP